MRELVTWLAEKTMFLDDRIDDIEEAYDELGQSVYEVHPAQLTRFLTKGSESYLIQSLYKLADGDIEELGYQLSKMSYKTAVFQSFLLKLINHLEDMSMLEEEDNNSGDVQEVNSRINTINYDVTCDNEHY